MTPEWSPEHRRLLSPPPAATSTPAPATTDAAAVSLPDDVVSDILSRLPVKSVSRLRCVCRGWRAIVSDPGFAALHRSRQAEPLIIASVYQEYPWGSRDLQLMDMDGNVVKVIKGGGSIGLLSTSMDVIVCVTDAFSYDAHVVDLATGDVLDKRCSHAACFMNSVYKYNYKYLEKKKYNYKHLFFAGKLQAAN
nr:F-box protein At3g07870-like [Aegilops tauschii subsp. strangulata]